MMARPAKKTTAKKATAKKATATKATAQKSTARKEAAATEAEATAKTTAAKKTATKQSATTKPRASALADATGTTRRRSAADREKAARTRSSSSDKRRATHDKPIKKGFAHRLYTGEASYDFMKNRRQWYLISGIILLICIGSIIFRGLNLGIEFTGGTVFQVPTKVTPQTIGDVGSVVEGTGLPDLGGTSVVTVGDHTARVQTRTMTPEEVSKVRNALASHVGANANEVTYSTVGGSWGRQITEKGIQALVVFLVLVGLMIWAYFRDWKMSVAALVALLHDLIVTVGVYSLTGFTVTPATLIGVLTILGYSLYDTVVVFDKVRENVAGIFKQKHTYSEQANLAINQVLVRSINTTIIGVLPVAAILIAALFVLGPGPLEDLGLALFVGMIAGAYSSLFIATPLLAQLREREPEMAAHRAKLGKRDARHARGSAVSGDRPDTDDDVEDDELDSETVERRGNRDVVVNKVGETPWELEGVEVDELDDADLAEADEVDEAPAPTNRAGRRQNRRPSKSRR